VSEELRLRVARGRPVTVVAAGEIDIVTAPRLGQALDEALAAAGRSVVLDFHGVTFCDSSGMHILLRAAHQADRAHQDLRLTGVADDIARAFRLVGIAAELGLARCLSSP
jgi:anti-sigma B factor antagonist